MIYVVSENKFEIFNTDFIYITVEESLNLLYKCNILQYDSETTNLDPHLNKILCIQFGSKKYNFKMVIDITTIDILLYKEILESKNLIGHNLKFDLQFLYNHKIIPRKLWDTMIVEQLLYLGYPKGIISYSLQAVAARRLSIYIDKEIRGQINSRGLDADVIRYAAMDVAYLEDIASLQKKELLKNNMLLGAIIENDFVPVIAYLEWCGIKLDIDQWKAKMRRDSINLEESKEKLDTFVINNPSLKKFIKRPLIGDLFEYVDLDKPICIINWSSSKQVIEVAKILGFNTIIKDKKTGEEKESVLEKHLKKQKGINDEFLELYFNYQGYAKIVSSFGQGHLNIIHPKTGRIHTNYNQLGTVTGRMSSGGGINKEIAIIKKLKPSECSLPNMQQLPSNHETRGSFISEEGNLFCSCDYDGMEARLGAIIYKEQAFIDEFLKGSGDLHSVWAKYAFYEILKNVSTKDIKKLYPDLRQKAKAYGFDYCRPLT